ACPKCAYCNLSRIGARQGDGNIREGVGMRAEEEREYVEYVSARLPVLHRAAYLLCGDGHRADDIVQATITSLYRHWRRARAADSVDAYVQRMLIRKHLEEKRRGWARVRLVAEPPERLAP